MTRFLDTRGLANLAIAVCDRCKRKKSITALYPDRNSPGLRVCDPCNDVFDPWRLPAPAPNKLTLMYPRPDTPLDVNDSSSVSTIFILDSSLLDGPDTLA